MLMAVDENGAIAQGDRCDLVDLDHRSPMIYRRSLSRWSDDAEDFMLTMMLMITMAKMRFCDDGAHER